MNTIPFNNTIFWKGDITGLGIRKTSPIFQSVIEPSQENDDRLYAALLDPERFAAAHVLLTIEHDVSFDRSGKAWNKLPVSLWNDGKVEYDPNAMQILRAYWALKLKRRE